MPPLLSTTLYKAETLPVIINSVDALDIGLGPWVICEYNINHFTLLYTHSKEKEDKKNGNHWNTCTAGTRPGRPGASVAKIHRAHILENYYILLKSVLVEQTPND